MSKRTPRKLSQMALVRNKFFVLRDINSKNLTVSLSVPGQVHFFPAIANTEDLIRGFERHGCAKL